MRFKILAGLRPNNLFRAVITRSSYCHQHLVNLDHRQRVPLAISQQRLPDARSFNGINPA